MYEVVKKATDKDFLFFVYEVAVSLFFGLFDVCLEKCCPTMNQNFILLSCSNNSNNKTTHVLRIFLLAPRINTFSISLFPFIIAMSLLYNNNYKLLFPLLIVSGRNNGFLSFKHQNRVISTTLPSKFFSNQSHSLYIFIHSFSISVFFGLILFPRGTFHISYLNYYNCLQQVPSLYKPFLLIHIKQSHAIDPPKPQL